MSRLFPREFSTRISRFRAQLVPSERAARTIVLCSFTNSIGFGLYQAGGVVYFVHALGIPAPQVGLALSLSAVTGIIAGVPVGHLADRVGAKRVAILMAGWKVIPLVWATQISGFWQLLAVLALLNTGQSGWTVANEAFIAGAMQGDRRTRLAAYIRSFDNIGMTIGTLLAAIVLAVNTDLAYESLVVGYALASVLGGLWYLVLPSARATVPNARIGLFAAVKDTRFLLVAQLSMMTLLSDVTLMVALPVWVIQSTDAPRVIVAILVATNTVLVVLMQVRVSKRAEGIAGIRLAQKKAFAWLVLMCILAAASKYVTETWSIVLLLGTAVALTFGELWGQSAGWGLRYSFARGDAQGQYGGAFRLAQIVPRVLGPVFMTAVVVRTNLAGWSIMALLFCACLLLSSYVIDWAWSNRVLASGGDQR